MSTPFQSTTQASHIPTSLPYSNSSDMSPQEWVGYSFLFIAILLIFTCLASILLRRYYQRKMREDANYRQKITAKLSQITNDLEHGEIRIENHPKELNVPSLLREPSKGKQNE